MKRIERVGYTPILKKKIDKKSVINYETLDIDKITSLLNKTITDNVYNTFDLLKLIKDEFNNSILETIQNIKDYSKVRFNCYYASIKLKEELSNIGIESNIFSYKSIGFSSKAGDNLIKEAHMALSIVTKRDGRIYYIILDPGLRIPVPLGFYEDDKKTVINVDDDVITIEHTGDSEYPYSMEMVGYNRYSTSNVSYSCKEYFNIEYVTINPLDVLFPVSFNILEGYRAIRFSSNKEEWAIIKLMLIDKVLECVDCNNYETFNFDEINNLSDTKFKNILTPYTKKLDIDTLELIQIIRFVINHYDEMISNLNEDVLKEFKNKRL